MLRLLCMCTASMSLLFGPTGAAAQSAVIVHTAEHDSKISNQPTSATSTPQPELHTVGSCTRQQPCYTESATPQNPLPEWRRPEWVMVYVTLVYSFFTFLMWVTIRRQANLLERQINEARDAADSSSTLAESTLKAIERQGLSMRRQTTVLRKSAEAALLNAQAVVNAERAVLLFKVRKEPLPGVPGSSQFHIEIVNYGNAPARRIEISKPIHATMLLSDFVAKPPDYGDGPEDELEATLEWLAPKEAWPVTTFVPSRHRDAVIDASRRANLAPGQIENMIYGQVTYYDGISPEKRYSRYCFAHEKDSFTNIGGSLAPCGLDEHSECT